MNKKLYIFRRILLSFALILSLASCSYEEEPERTSDATSSYVTPKGVLPTQEERDYVQQCVNEYETYLKTH